ncbi:MAG: UDP-N-acetylglucosamine 2-epimerase (hydrolyzing) [Candidatus Omnitrophica bacterium]|nr:UDP-N-acetylglucosamine 2-epimerase (hydrolyzing) [Candidatus Omnitrophota bacterium]
MASVNQHPGRVKKNLGNIKRTTENMSKRKIAIFTGNRAEYGLQYPIIKAIHSHPQLEYYLLVSGAHLQENFGYTVKEIEQDGFKVHREVKLDMPSDDLFGTAQAIGSGILSLSQILKDLKPDILVVYADRFEGFAAVITGTQMGIPTAHIEGGDITEGGALDDMVRHAMTKLAHLHFTTNADASLRITKMGEEPWRIYTVGFPAIDVIMEGRYAKPVEIQEKYHIDLNRPVVLYTQHSIATEFKQAGEQIIPALNALSNLAAEGLQVVMTFPNNDAGSSLIVDCLKALDVNKKKNIQLHASLGRYFYHGFLSLCGRVGRGVCVGNSSSGIKETVAFGCPTVNIGDRQKGRLRALNVIDVDYDENKIYAAIKRCIEDKDFRHLCQTCENPYGTGDAGKKIAETLAGVPLDLKLLQKKMTY